MNPGGPGHLGDPTNGVFNLSRGKKNDVSQLINNNDNIGQGGKPRKLIIGFNISYPCFGKKFVAPIHFADGPF